MARPVTRSSNRTAALVGLGVIVAMLTGVGGHQLFAAGELTLAPLSTHESSGGGLATSRAAGAPMCPVALGAVPDGRSSSLVTVGDDQWRAARSAWSSDGPVGVGGVCD